MTYKYLKKIRGAGGYGGIRVLHITQDDGETSKCGAIKKDDDRYEIVERSTQAIRALMCSNCLNTGRRKGT